MTISLKNCVTTLFRFTEPGDIVRPHPMGKFYVVMDASSDETGTLFNAVCFTNGRKARFEPDEKVDVFPSVKIEI